MEPLAIRTHDLRRTYRRKKAKKLDAAGKPLGDFIALDGVNVEVKQGELFGLLGPNGAGKTTLIKILTTLLSPTSGQAWVDGKDVVTESAKLRPIINVVSGGESCGYGVLNVRENLWLFTQIYGVSNAEAKIRIDRMLEVVGLSDKAGTKVSHLSTGQRQKMNFCRGFITDPKILFLDEPTLGLDVNAARAIRDFVREWLKADPTRTMLLTTHYMAEADELCDRLAIIDKGKVLACDTPTNLKKRVQEHPLFVLTLERGRLTQEHFAAIPGVLSVVLEPQEALLTVRLSLAEDAVIGAVVRTVLDHDGSIRSLDKKEATLEDVFISLVGHGLTTTEEPA